MVQKNYCWIWIAVDRNGHRFVNCKIGKRRTKTGKKLRNKMEAFTKGVVYADYWKDYNEFVPKEQLFKQKQKHIQ